MRELASFPREAIAKDRRKRRPVPRARAGRVKGTGRPLNSIVAAFIGSLVIPVYFLRLMADGRKLHRGLRARDASQAGLRPGAPDEVYE